MRARPRFNKDEVVDEDDDVDDAIRCKVLGETDDDDFRNKTRAMADIYLFLNFALSKKFHHSIFMILSIYMKVEMTQLYLCEEPYWSKYDQSDLYEHPIEINVISDGKLQHLVPCSSNLVYWYSGGYKSIFSFPFRHYSIASAGRGSFSRRNPSDESIIVDYHCGRC